MSDCQAYLLTCFGKDGAPFQIAIVIDCDDKKFEGPIKCCTNASARIFWRTQLVDYGVDRVGNLKPIAGATFL